jgi:3',5'-nucleoside bisphosphate phosphatase
VIDLHVHSSRSDGTDSPKELVDIAAAAGCTTFALTDHDTTSGIVEAQNAAKEVGIDVIAGLELSCHVEQQSVHLLGYFIDIANPRLVNFLEDQRRLRSGRNDELILRLNELGVNLTEEDVANGYTGDSLGRPHFASALVRSGHAESISDAFAKFLGPGTPTHVKRNDLPAEDAIELLHSVGGVVAWAHPLSHGRSDNTRFMHGLSVLKDAGIDGIEAWYGAYDPTMRSQLAEIASDHGLVATGGSDYHGKHKPSLNLGTGTGDLDVPPETLNQLRNLKQFAK